MQLVYGDMETLNERIYLISYLYLTRTEIAAVLVCGFGYQFGGFGCQFFS